MKYDDGWYLDLDETTKNQDKGIDRLNNMCLQKESLSIVVIKYWEPSSKFIRSRRVFGLVGLKSDFSESFQEKRL